MLGASEQLLAAWPRFVQETGCTLTYDPWSHRVLLGTKLADGRPAIPRSQVVISTE